MAAQALQARVRAEGLGSGGHRVPLLGSIKRIPGGCIASRRQLPVPALALKTTSDSIRHTTTGSAYFGRSRAGLHFCPEAPLPAVTKSFKTYDQQVDLLASRGMGVDDRQAAIRQLQQVNYYRLSGYWYPFRRQTGQDREDDFYPGTTFHDVVKLYKFDEALRTATFASLTPIELTVRALLGHELGIIDERAHLKPGLLGPRASQGADYATWIRRYEKNLKESKEDFVKHHHTKYGGTLPVWAAVEILDWGALTYLYGFSPRSVQDSVADKFGLTAPQLGSWMRSLNVVRNVCAHHGRLFNKVHAIKPKLPNVGKFPSLDLARNNMNRTYGQLSLIQHLLHHLGIGRPRLLPTVLRSYPDVGLLPLSHTGAPTDWDGSALWS